MAEERAWIGGGESTGTLAVLIAAEHARVRSSLFSLLSSDGGFSTVTASELVRAVRALRAAHTDVVLLDGAILGTARLRRVPMLLAAAPRAVLLVVGMGDHPGYDRAARNAGAGGYLRLDQPPEMLVGAVRRAWSARHG